MASGYEVILVEALARLRAGPNIVSNMALVKRAHRTIVPRETSFSVHVVDGPDEPRKDGKNSGCAWRYGSFTVSLFARNDLGPTVLDPLKIEVYRRLSIAFAAGITVNPGRITIDTEVADADAVRVDMDFDCKYPVRGEWSLELP